VGVKQQQLVAWASAAVSISKGGSLTSSYWVTGAAGQPACSLTGLLVKAVARHAALSAAAAQPQAAKEPVGCPLYEISYQTEEPDNRLTASSPGSGCGCFSIASGLQPAAAAATAVALLQQGLHARLGLPEAVTSCDNINTVAAGSVLAAAQGSDSAPSMLLSMLYAAAAETGGSVGTIQRRSPQADAANILADFKYSSAPAGAAGAMYGSAHAASTAAAAHLLPSLAPTVDGPIQLVPSPCGSFGSLVPRPVALSELPAGHLGVKVAAVGVNFRDVLNVLGMYPGDPGAPGSDVAGVVVAGGSSSSLRPGQAVFGLTVGALGTAVTCPAETVVAMPPCLSFEAASSMPTVFITAQMAMGAVTGLRLGERVLVHAAAGGVGLAALQVVSSVGAIAIATAGSPSKRSLLRSQGVHAVVGSRDSVFVGPVSCLGGVDVVLNSLTSPGMVGGSLAVLKQGGRFVEIGKRDIWAPAAVAAERPDVCFSLLAVDFLPGQVVQSALQRVAAGVAAGRLAPLPTVGYSLAAAASALRQMSQARHVGKVVVSSSLSSAPSHALGRVLVTGGLGALGSLVAGWLSGHGVQQLHLLGRAGKLQDGAAVHHLLSSNGSNSQVIISQCDAGSSEDLAAAVSSSRQLLPVNLIIHAGGVLADATLQQQQLRGVRQVVGAKLSPVAGLLRACGHHPVRSVVLFSSVASLLGSPGQSNYAAANAGLDAAARAGQVCGLPAVSVQWGAWSGGGMASGDAQIAARVERMGMSLISPAAGLAALEGVLAVTGAVLSGIPVVAAVPFRWPRMLQRLGQPVPEFFAEFAPSAATDAGAAERSNKHRKQRAAQQVSAQPQQVLEKVQNSITAILGHEVRDHQCCLVPEGACARLSPQSPLLILLIFTRSLGSNVPIARAACLTIVATT
jgi:NADPH:quinone reductase-like Zn-dependent oxidoreductase